MGTLTRNYRNQVNASPNQMEVISVSATPAGLVEFTIDNTDNSGDVWIRLYDDTSGTVNLSTSTPVYGPLHAGGQSSVTSNRATESSPLCYFSRAITVVATTTRDGAISPASYVAVTLHYYK